MEYTREKIRTLLEEMAEPEYAKFSASLLGREAVVLGVRLPKLRVFAKKVAQTDGMEYLERATEDARSMEELMLYGMVVGCMKEGLETLFPYIERYVAQIDNWSLCDSFCSGLKQTKREPELMWNFLQPYLRSEREFDVRFGVVMLMDYYVMPECIDELLRIFDEISHEGYYVKMAVAWALSVCLAKEWEKSFAYMRSPGNRLDEFTFRKTVQKCRESFRLTKEQKESLKLCLERRGRE